MDEKKIFILTGPVRTGKTTRLLHWSSSINNVKGIATPLINEKRVFQDLSTNNIFNMEADPGETNIISVGRYKFSRHSFERAVKIIEDGISDSEWMIIDEIGPLELYEEGFSNILRKILNIEMRSFDLVLVIRESILSDVKKYFKIENEEYLNIF